MLLKSSKIFNFCTSLQKLKRTSSICLTDKQLQALEQQAFLSSLVINKIRFQKLQEIKQVNNESYIMQKSMSQNLFKKSLRDQIIEMLDQKANNYKIASQNLAQIKKIFIEGIPLENQILDQSSFSEGLKDPNPQVKNLSRSNSVGNSLKGTPETKTKNFVFFPTYMVTGQIFNKIFQIIELDQKRCYLYTGYYGISKSVSTKLFNILSNKIAKYNVLTHEQNIRETKIQRFIIKNAPKTIYESFWENNTYMTLMNIRSRILDQCSQIDSSLKHLFLDFQLKNPIDDRLNLQQYYYERGCKIILFYDQINQIFATEAKKSNEQLLDIKKGIQPKQNKNNIIVQRFRKFFDYIRYQFPLIILFSSLTVQKRLLQKFKFGKQGQQVHMEQVQYVQNLPFIQSMFQVVDEFLFEIQNRFGFKILKQTIHIDASVINEIKQTWPQFQQKQLKILEILRYLLVKKLIKMPDSYSLNFLMIRRTLSKEANMIKNNSKQEPIQYTVQNFRNFRNQIQRLFDLTIQNSKKHIESKLAYLFNENIQSKSINQNQRQTMIFTLYNAAVQSNSRRNYKNLYQINVNPFTSQQEFQQISKKLDNHLFCCEDQKIFNYVPPGVIKQCLQTFFSKAAQYIIQNKKQQFRTYYGSEKFGGIMQNAFIRMCYKSKVSILLNFPASQYQNLALNNFDKVLQKFKPIPFYKRGIQTQQKRQYNWKFLESFISMRFFAITPQNITGNLAKKLNKQSIGYQFTNYLTFQANTQSSNIVKVLNKQNKNPLLINYVGYLTINESLIVKSLKLDPQVKTGFEQNKQSFLYWKAIQQILYKPKNVSTKMNTKYLAKQVKNIYQQVQGKHMTNLFKIMQIQLFKQLYNFWFIEYWNLIYLLSFYCHFIIFVCSEFQSHIFCIELLNT